MSHTTTIDDIVFNDVEALRSAVAELNKQGIKCRLEKGGKPRAFYATQQGMENPDYTLVLENSRFDVGFFQNKQKKGLEARADFWGGHIESQIGAKVKKGESDAQRNMGKLYQAYVVAAATRQAIRQGYSVRKVQKDDGTVQLVMTGIKV